MSQDWQERADELHQEGGVPPVRSRVVALREQGRIYEEIADELEISSRGAVSNHVNAYEAQRDRAQWLLDNGPGEEQLEASD